jgi:hypothetical protein
MMGPMPISRIELRPADQQPVALEQPVEQPAEQPVEQPAALEQPVAL